MRNTISPPYRLCEGSLRDIERLMTGRVGSDQRNGTASLVDKLHLLGIGNEDLVPDVVALTIRSAVPVADVVRGVYEAAEVSLPTIIGVNSNTDARYLYREYPRKRSAEVERLKELVASASSAVVLDQFVKTGDTINYTRQLLKEAGVKECASIKGSWYEESDSEMTYVDNLTSPFAEQLRLIGRTCYAQFMKKRSHK